MVILYPATMFIQTDGTDGTTAPEIDMGWRRGTYSDTTGTYSDENGTYTWSSSNVVYIEDDSQKAIVYEVSREHLDNVRNAFEQANLLFSRLQVYFRFVEYRFSSRATES